MFIKKFPAVVQKVVSVLIKLSVLVFIIIIGYLGYKVFPSVGSRQMSATMNIPMLIPQLSIVIGCALMSLQLIGVLIREFYKGGEPNA
jgi:TRAP-type C4-dicarboxylate transport system permease small subunit